MVNNKNKLIISLTTIPSRINELDEVLDSLINQRLKADMIFINIPKQYKRFNQPIVIPDSFHTKYKNTVKVYFLDEDFGPATKFIGSLKNPEISKDDVIIVTDDDVVKKRNWTIKLLRCYEKNKICSFEERRLGKQILWGYLGYIFKKDIFDLNDMLSFYNKIKNNCFLVDDHWLTGYCHYKQIPIDNIRIIKASEINHNFQISNDSLVRLKGDEKRSKVSEKCRKDIYDKFNTEFPFWCCLGCCKKGKRITEGFSNSNKSIKLDKLKLILKISLIGILIYKFIPKESLYRFLKLTPFAILIFYLLYKRESNIGTENDEQSIEKFSNTIPNVIMQTYHKKKNIPKKVYDNIKKYAPDYKHIIFDDQECIEFIQKYYSDSVVNTFHKLKGAHKADLFRYCYLYKFGGIYLDIKTELIRPLNEIFLNNYTYSVLSIINNTVYQGVIAAPPQNPIFLKLIYFMVKLRERKSNFPYIIFTIDFHQKVKQYCNNKPVIGFNKNLTNEFDFYLFQEKCTKNAKDCKDGLDRYKLCCYIYDGDEKVFKSRYSDFPWN